jgi:chromosome segregation ATPase
MTTFNVVSSPITSIRKLTRLSEDNEDIISSSSDTIKISNSMKSKANANKITNNHLSNNDNIHTASQQIANNNNNSNNVSLQRNSNNESELYTSVLEKISKCETLLSELKETERMLQTKLQQQSPEECMKQMLTIIAQEARQEQENVARMESELQRIERAIADIETEIDSLQTEKEKLQLFIEMVRPTRSLFL